MKNRREAQHGAGRPPEVRRASPKRSPAAASRWVRTCASLALAAALLLTALNAQALPVRTLIAGPGTADERAFLNELQLLWGELLGPVPDRLALRHATDPRRRMHDLARRHGDFALVNAATAKVYLGEYPQLTALAVLWADLLHPLTRNPADSEVRLDTPAELWVFSNAPYPYAILQELARNNNKVKTQVALLDESLIPDALDFADKPLMLYSAPWPDPALRRIMSRDASLRLLPFAGNLLEEFTLSVPWLIAARLPPRSYPGQERGLELPALYHVMLVRNDLPEGQAEKMLNALYRYQRALGPGHPLFARMEGQLNAVFGKVLPFHKVTARRYNFQSIAP